MLCCMHEINIYKYMCLALLYSVFGVIVEKARGAEDDLNTIVAGTMTGVLYKSPGRSCIIICLSH